MASGYRGQQREQKAKEEQRQGRVGNKNRPMIQLAAWRSLPPMDAYLSRF